MLCTPKKSGSWESMIETAIPVVNPLVTGQGMNLIKVPMRVSPALWTQIFLDTSLSFPYGK
jgi:hypothetical protein